MIKIVDLVRIKYLFHCRFDFLTEWEQDFINTIIGREITPKQVEKVEEIYRRQRMLERKL